jgi:hypothetical protein
VKLERKWAVTFAVMPVDNSLLDAAQTSLISASASGYPATSAALRAVSVSVASDDKGLTLTIPDAAMPENTGLVTATITRIGLDFTSPLTVTLSSNSARLALPASVVLPANVVSTAVPVSAVDNSLVDGSTNVVLKAAAAGHVSGSDTLTVTDDDAAVQTWVVDSATDENDGNLTAGNLSLREAIAAANLFAGKGRITFSTAVGSPFATAAPAKIVMSLEEFLIKGNVSIEGPAQGVTIDGGNLSRVLNVDDGSATATPRGVYISKLFLTRGLAITVGGCVRNHEALKLVDTSITASRTSSYNAFGCGLENGGSARLEQCTVSGNNSTNERAQGAGIFNSGSLILTNSTLAGNQGGFSTQGGGLQNTGLAVLTHVTVAENFIDYSGSGSGISNSGTLVLTNSIVSNNTGITTGELAGNFTSYGVNLVRNLQPGIVPTAPGSILTADPLFVGLGSHGGLSQTMRLALGSPAINAGDDAIVAAAGLANVQRGLPRLSGSAVNLGSVEIQVGSLTYASWSTTQLPAGTSAGNQAFNADFDRDGLANGLEFYFGSDPCLATPSALNFTRDTAAGVMRVSYPHLVSTRASAV